MIRRAIKNLLNRSDFGLILDWDFHRKNRWVSAYTPFLVQEMLNQFKPIVISTQAHYDFHKNRLKYIFSFEPEWAAPRIVFDHRIECVKGVMYSDPHWQTERRQLYFENSGFDFVFSLYNTPFFHHFKRIPEHKFVHFPWAVPDQFISTHALSVRSDEVAIFGGKNSDAYDVRNWCREQSCVSNYDLSGVENKVMTDKEYYSWLTQFDAIVAAGSSLPLYNLVTPKYFEIASSGALLIGQSCDDLPLLGFDESNSLQFTKIDFIDKVNNYKADPGQYLEIRENSRKLIYKRHKLSDRIDMLRVKFNYQAC